MSTRNPVAGSPPGARTPRALLAILLWLPASLHPAHAHLQSRPADDQAETPLSELVLHALPDETAAAQDIQEFPVVRAAFQEAEDLLAAGDPRAALAKLNQADDDDDGRFFEVHALRARAAARLGDLGLARRSAHRARALRPDSAAINALLGQLHQAAGEAGLAVAYFRAATLAAEREPDSPHVTRSWFALGELLMRQGRLRAAAEAYDRFDRTIWQTHPEHRLADDIRPILEMWPRGAIEQRIELCRRRALPESAVEIARWATTVLPEDPFATLLLAQAHLDAGRPAEALALCEQTLDAAPLRPLPLRIELRARRAAGRLDPLITELAARATEADARTVVRTADQLTALGEYDGAARLWEALCQARPDDLEVRLGSASNHLHSGKPREALAAIASILKANPRSADAPLLRLEACLRPQPTPDGLAVFVQQQRSLAARDPADNVALALLATAAGEHSSARELLEAALADQPELTLAEVLRGMIALRDYRWQDAIASAEAVRARDDRQALADYIAGVAHDALGEAAEALAALKRAVARKPADPGLLVALGQQHRRASQRAAPELRSQERLAAQRYLSEALTLDPTCGAALEELIDAYLEDRKLEIARSRFERSRCDDLPADILRRAGTAVRFAVAPEEDLIDELERQHVSFPGDALTTLKLARAYLQRGRHEEADALARSLGGDRQIEDEAVMIMAFAAQRRLEFGAAAEHVARLVARYPGRRALRRAWAYHLLHDFQWEAARRLLVELTELERGADASEAPETLLQWHIEFQDYAGGLDLIERWSQSLPERQLTAWRLRLLVLAGRVREAEELLERATERRSFLADFYVACIEARRPEAALERLSRARSEQPDDEQLTYWLFHALREAQRFDEALTLLGELPVDTLDASNQRRYLAADCLRRAGKFADAITEFEALASERFLSRDAREAVVEGLILAQALGGEVDAALAAIDRHTADDGERRVLRLRWRRVVFDICGRSDDYLRVSEELHALSPQDATLNNDLGYLLADRGERLEEATRMIRLAVAQEPLNAAYLDSLGWALYKAGDFDAARLWLSRATRLRDGDDDVLWDHLGDVLGRLGDMSGAQTAWRRSLEAMNITRPDTPRDRERRELLRTAVERKIHAAERGQAPPVAPAATDPR